MFNAGILASAKGGLNPAGGVVNLSPYLEYLAKDTALTSGVYAVFGNGGTASSVGSNTTWVSRPANYNWIDDPKYAPNFQILGTVQTYNTVDSFTGTGAWYNLSDPTPIRIGINRARPSPSTTPSWAYIRLQIRRISTGTVEATGDIYLKIET